jgi:hypothetical protein
MINQLDGSVDFGEGAQLLCHDYAVRLCEIPGTELKKGHQHAALTLQMLIEGESSQVGLDHLTGFVFILGIGMIESAERLHFLFQRGLQFLISARRKSNRKRSSVH